MPDCWNWSASVTDLAVTWGDSDWISLYRGADCSSSEKLTFKRDDIDPVDGKSCHATKMVRGQDYVHVFSDGSVMFGKGIAPTDAIFAIPKITPSENSVMVKLMRLRNGELKAP